jgi:outer membrane protein assembly factor BamD
MPTARSTALAGCLLATLLAAPGCASKPKIKAARPAEEIYQKAQREMDRKRWDVAAEEFRTLVDTHPYHELTPHAEIRLGEMYFLEQRYTEAIAVFEGFLKIRPTHRHAAYALYLLGSAHYHERATYDRDPTETAKAAQAFERLLREHPGSPYDERSRARLAEARGELAAHELYVGNFYFKQKKFEAARRRYEKVWRLYPEQPSAERARVRAGEAELKLGRRDAARATLSRVVHGATDRRLAGRAEALLRDAALEPLAASEAPVEAPAEGRAPVPTALPASGSRAATH